MFQNNFPNNFSDIDFNYMYNSANPIIDSNPMEMNSINNSQVNNQMNQNLDNNNITYNDKVNLNFGFNERNFQVFSQCLNCLTDPKKKLYISNTEQKKEILVPIYFTKKELYAYLKFFGNIAIIYNNNILNNDQTSIDDIPNNSTIILFNIPNKFNYRTSSLFKYLESLFPDKNKINIACRTTDGQFLNFYFPSNIFLSLTIKFISVVLGLNDECCFIFNGSTIDKKSNIKIKDFFKLDIINDLTINDSNDLLGLNQFFGKEIKVAMFLKNKETFQFKKMHKYMPICDLYNDLKEEEVTKIFINGLLISKDDHRSLASFGINDDFGCVVE